jgi:arginyl-tRNA synthetase
VIEFSSPNIAKQFHAGHLRSTIIKGFLSNLYEGAGWQTIRMNYLGDWGRQYGLLAVGWKKYGDQKAFDTNPIAHLFDVYVKTSTDFQPEEDEFKAAGKHGEDTAILESRGLLGEVKAYFKRMEDGDEEALALWRKFREISIEKYETTYARLNIHFTDYSGESTVKRETMEMAEQILLEKGIAERDNGAVLIDFKKHGAKKLDVALIRNRNGTSNYLLRDIGAAIQKQQTYNMDKMIYVVMSEQETHLKRLFKILELMGGEYTTLAMKLQHVTYGKVRSEIFEI